MTSTSADAAVELVFVRGVAYLVPVIRPDMPPRLRRLLRLRREATISGHCPRCPATVTGGSPLSPGLGELVMEHEAWCPVTDATLGPLYPRWWRRRAS